MKSTYLSINDSDVRTALPTRQGRAIVSFVLAFFVAVLVALPFLPGVKDYEFSESSAGLFCSGSIGSGMVGRASWDSDNYVLPDHAPRVFGVNEIFHKAGYVAYNGEGEASWIQGSRDKADEEDANVVPDWVKTDKGTLEAARESCSILTGIPRHLGNFALGGANAVIGIAQFVITMSFNADLVCADPANPEGACINLIGIIGGTSGNSGDGIIGTLTSSIYLPLVLFAAVLTGLWVLITGLIKGAVREAFVGVAWSFIAGFMGLVLLFSPQEIAKAPMTVSNSIAGCVMGAFNGVNCMSNESIPSSTLDTSVATEDVCAINVSGTDFRSSMQTMVAGLNCNVWKAFVLNPMSIGQYGVSFDELYTNKEPLSGILTGKGLNPEDYCVNMGSTQSVEAQKRKKLSLDAGPKVCNLMLYQMALQTNVSLPDDGDKWNNDLNEDTRWYRIVDAAAADEGMWQSWSQSMAADGSRFMIGVLSFLVSIPGVIVLVISALFALVYLISALFLMAFAPVFLLMAVHPGRGKRLFLGWFEKVVSNVLKYIASAVFLIVAISIYGGIMSNITSFPTTIVFVILMTMALLMYRKEIVELFGRANMGGEQLSSRMSDKLKEKGSGFMKSTGAVAGGMVGASMANHESVVFNRKGMKDRMGALMNNARAAKSGASDTFKREMAASSNKFVSGVGRSVQRQSNANRSEIGKRARQAEQEAKVAQDDLQQSEAQVASINAQIGDSINDRERLGARVAPEANKLAQAKVAAGKAAAQSTAQSLAERRIVESMKELREQRNSGEITNEEYRDRVDSLKESTGTLKVEIENDLSQAAELTRQDAELSLRIENAEAHGHYEMAESLRTEQLQGRARYQEIYDKYDDSELDTFNANFKDSMRQQVESRGIDLNTAKAQEKDRIAAGLDSDLNVYDLNKKREEAIAVRDDKQRIYDEKKAVADVWAKKQDRTNVGDTVRQKHLDKTERRAERAAEKSGQNQPIGKSAPDWTREATTDKPKQAQDTTSFPSYKQDQDKPKPFAPKPDQDKPKSEPKQERKPEPRKPQPETQQSDKRPFDPRPESKPESRSEPKQERKPEPRKPQPETQQSDKRPFDPRPESKPESRSEPKQERKPEPRRDTPKTFNPRPEPKPENRSEPKPAQQRKPQPRQSEVPRPEPTKPAPTRQDAPRQQSEPRRQEQPQWQPEAQPQPRREQPKRQERPRSTSSRQSVPEPPKGRRSGLFGRPKQQQVNDAGNQPIGKAKPENAQSKKQGRRWTRPIANEEGSTDG